MKHPAFRYLILAGILSASPALAADEGGLPQMDVHTYPSQLFWLFVCFVTLYAVFSRISLPRVGETLERRAAQKDGDLKQAAEWNDDADRVKAEYERSLARARDTATVNVAAAERDISASIADEQAKFADTARKRLTTAEQGIAKAKAEALASLADISADLTAEMVQKIAGIQVNKADAKKAVTTAMQEV
jgi:F-type H+-transporting ATPase subunit b